jgi:hypothetical protein
MSGMSMVPVGGDSQGRPSRRLTAAPVTADRIQAIIHDFVMLNALGDTSAARGAITLATELSPFGLSTVGAFA